MFTSIVLSAQNVPRDKSEKRKLIYRAWRKNASKDLVTFSFDVEGNLIGVIQQPARSTDDEELLVYFQVLAREADRFEFGITGLDRE